VLAFLVEHLPPQLHLVIVTREEPRLPLARLRVRDEVTELRVADLRFTPAETAAFLRQVMGLHLSAPDIGALEARTEGWVAGLQLAALSLQGRQDTSGFIQSFTGDHRSILEYLVEEVLNRQPAALRSFLLQTALLDQLHGPLCDAVTGQEGSSARLEALQRGNFFVMPLDDQRRWYRYHQLFANVLAAQLLAEQADQVATLHRRASIWYEQNGLTVEAIRHALAARDEQRAAELIEVAAPELHRQRREATVLGWLRALPDPLIASRPMLSVYYAGTLLSVGDLAGVEARLRDAERGLAHMQDRPDQSHDGIGGGDAAAVRRLPGAIAIYRAAQALALGDVAATAQYAGQALVWMPDEDPLWRGAATGLLGLATWTSGDLETAYRTFAAGLAQLQKAGNIADAIGGAVALADIRVTQGRLGEAQRIYERGLQLAVDHGAPQLRGTADMYVGMSEIAYARGDLQAALEHLSRSQQQGEHTGFPRHPYRWRLALARIRAAQADWGDALDLLHAAASRYVGDFFPNVWPVAAWQARVWIAQGRLNDARGWAREQHLSAQDDLSYLHEFEHITLARLLLAQAQRDSADATLREAIDLLERLHTAAEAGGRTGSEIEILVLLAAAHQLQGDLPAAMTAISRALTLAEPEGYVRVFVDAGQAIAALLKGMKDVGGRMQAYQYDVLQAFGEHVAGQPATFKHHHQPVIEPLSERERAVLRLLRSELTGPEIARELFVSLNTLRTHTKNIYAKLGVSSRRAAVRRADELDLR
jgi:LuxR family maltose regulon positive regulatory protein